MGLGVKCSKEVTTAIHRAILLANHSTVMGNGTPGNTRLANPIQFLEGDRILQLSAGMLHPCTQIHC